VANNAGPKTAASTALRPLLFGLLLLPALIPLLQGTALPCTHDNIFHSYRIVAMRDMLRHGWLFSRWVPNLALGYGYPFFNYREPLPYLAGEALYLTGLPLPLVLGLLYSTSLVCAAWGAYVLGRDLFGERAGWVAGVAYGLSPYLLMNALRRGNMPESVGLALVPWLFVTTRRIILHRRRSDVVVTVLLLVALFLSHNITSLLLALFLGAYALLMAWLYRDRGGWPYAFVAAGLAVLLTAWFWLPALTEQDYAQLHLSRTTRNNDYRFNFVTWREMLLTLPVPFDPGYLNAPMRVMVGIGQITLGILGAVLGLFQRQRSRLRAVVGLLVSAAVVYLWMATPGASGLWSKVGILSFVQFPWRMVGRALLPICLLAGLAVELVAARLSSRSRVVPDRVASWLVVPVVCLLVLLAWPETYPPKGMCPSSSSPDMRELYARETEGWLGMDPESSYFPIWVEDHPHDMALAEAFIGGDLPERFDVDVLPPNAQVLAAEYRPLWASLRISTPVGFTGRWLGLYFPGWSVSVDGQAVSVWPEEDSGLMLFDVPSGEHEVIVRFASTRPRRLGTGLTAIGVTLSAGLLLVISRWRRHERGDAAKSEEPDPCRATSAADRTTTTALVVAALALLLVRAVVVDRVETPVRRSRLGQERLPEVSTPIETHYASGLVLLGYSLGTEVLTTDSELVVNLLWQAGVPLKNSYQMTVLLRGADGQIWSPAGTARPRGYEDPVDTTAWPPGHYAYDPHLVTLLPGAPPGDYDVVVRLFVKDTLGLDSVLGPDGEPLGPDLVLGSITFARSKSVPELAALQVTADDGLSACGPLGLWSMVSDRTTGRPGDVVAVRWVWEALASPDTALEATLALLGPHNTVIREWALPPVAAWWPTDAWTPGDRWVGHHVVRLPGDLESGGYRLALSLPGCPDMAETPISIEAPDRAWSVPSGYDALSVVYLPLETQEGLFELAGLWLPDREVSGGQRLEVGLAWRALGSTDVSYRIYLHLLDAEGRLVAQDDGEPVAWSRPTTGWAMGEVVAETRQVTLPEDAEPGRYTLRVGLYEEEGPRLQTAEGDDGAILATITVR